MMKKRLVLCLDCRRRKVKIFYFISKIKGVLIEMCFRNIETFRTTKKFGEMRLCNAFHSLTLSAAAQQFEFVRIAELQPIMSKKSARYVGALYSNAMVKINSGYGRSLMRHTFCNEGSRAIFWNSSEEWLIMISCLNESLGGSYNL